MNKKKIILALDIILCVGLLTHSAILLYINRNFNPIYITNTDIRGRLELRKVAEFIFIICRSGYIVGNIIFAYQLVKKHLAIPLHRLLRYFVLQIVLMMLCIIPFAAFDLTYFKDYIFPVWGTAGTLFIIVFGTFVFGLCRKKKEM